MMHLTADMHACAMYEPREVAHRIANAGCRAVSCSSLILQLLLVVTKPQHDEAGRLVHSNAALLHSPVVVTSHTISHELSMIYTVASRSLFIPMMNTKCRGLLHAYSHRLGMDPHDRYKIAVASLDLRHSLVDKKNARRAHDHHNRRGEVSSISTELPSKALLCCITSSLLLDIQAQPCLQKAP